MKTFLDDDFLLQSETAGLLFHDYAEGMPIYDYHSHLPVKQIAENTRFRNLTHIWLEGDHYKWRLLRSNGIGEEYCTGKAPDYEKFIAWARTLPLAVGNPLYHWSHMELKNPFGITGKVLSPSTAEEIWNACGTLLAEDGFRAAGILRKMNVSLLCTTDDPADTLEYHKALSDDPGMPVRVLPCFRPDKAAAAGKGKEYREYLKKLGAAADMDISSFQALFGAIEKRHDAFHEAGCRLSDHAVDVPVYARASDGELEAVFRKALLGKSVSAAEEAAFRTALLLRVGELNAEKGWTMQLHVGAFRGVNTRLSSRLGPDTGFDAVRDGEIARPLAAFLNALEGSGGLPKVILYTLNPRDWELICALAGCFQGTEAAGKIQFGPAWWFNDHRDGMERHLRVLGNLGLFGRFTGMVTDSRSFLSFPRHEYFRRILCNLLGSWVENGELPHDIPFLGGIVRDICFNNAEKYFEMG